VNSGWGYLQATGAAATGLTIVLRDSQGGAKNAPASTTVDWMVMCQST
jgi:hypothetical protein